MKKAIIWLVLAAALVSLAGCAAPDRYALPEDPQVFSSEFYVCPEGYYPMIRVNGREFIYFGSLKTKVGRGDTGAVLGYILNPEFPEDTGTRIIALTATDDIVMQYYVGGIMEQPMFLRAVDTIGKDITVPAFIEPYGDSIWGDND